MGRNNKSTMPQTSAGQLSSIIKSCRDIMRKDKGLNGDSDRLPMLTWIMFLKFLDDMEKMHETESKMEGKRYASAIQSPYRWRDWAAKEEGVTGEDLISFINNDECVRPDGSRGAGLFAYLKKLEGSKRGDRRTVIATVFRGTLNRMQSGYLLRDVINKVNDIHFTSTEEIFTLSHLYESLLKEMRDSAGDAGEFYTPRAVVKFMVNAVNPRLGEIVLDPSCGTGGFLVEAFEHIKRQCKSVENHKILQEETTFGGEAKSLPYLLCQMNLLLHGLDSPSIDSGNSLRFPLNEIGDKDRVDVIVTNPPFGGEEEKGPDEEARPGPGVVEHPLGIDHRDRRLIFEIVYGILRNRLRRDGYNSLTDEVYDMLQAIKVVRPGGRVGVIGYYGDELAEIRRLLAEMENSGK